VAEKIFKFLMRKQHGKPLTYIEAGVILTHTPKNEFL
jgi:hypothetical protein